ncbi:GNAT family protein [Maridesulfovibrio sp.]|uniref:GNAT family N-acetyltransferase n=1 Tax=Maridesulfovibrio sp. TaxID=2795000 RepID=UPI002A18CDE1|nr:GNAT family protein [Maridesulfovibrio sp.]
MDGLDKPENLIVNGKNVYLRPISLDDVSESYVNWMNDPQINQYLESRFTTQTLNSVKDFVKAMIESPDNILFAICEKDSGRHVGNIKMGPLNTAHSHAEIGLLIGEKECWGKGYGSEAIGLVIEYAFKTLNIHRLTAGAYANNIGSVKAFEKNGFTVEGIYKKHFLHNGVFIDATRMGIINPDYRHEQ